MNNQVQNQSWVHQRRQGLPSLRLHSFMWKVGTLELSILMSWRAKADGSILRINISYSARYEEYMIVLRLFLSWRSSGTYVLWTHTDNLTFKPFIGDTSSRGPTKKIKLQITHWRWPIIISVTFIGIIFFGVEVRYYIILTLTPWTGSRESLRQR